MIIRLLKSIFAPKTKVSISYFGKCHPDLAKLIDDVGAAKVQLGYSYTNDHAGYYRYVVTSDDLIILALKHGALFNKYVCIL